MYLFEIPVGSRLDGCASVANNNNKIIKTKWEE